VGPAKRRDDISALALSGAGDYRPDLNQSAFGLPKVIAVGSACSPHRALQQCRVETTLLQQFAREIRVSDRANRVALEKSVAIINHWVSDGGLLGGNGQTRTGRQCSRSTEDPA
jgi:hypothetical protein